MDLNSKLTKAREARSAAADEMDRMAASNEAWTDERRAKFSELEQTAAAALEEVQMCERALKLGPHSPAIKDQLGLSDKEKRNYSLIKLLRAQAFRHENPKLLESAAFELECSRAIGQKIGREALGVYVPREVWGDSPESRTLNVATGDAGGFLVADELRPDLFIGQLRNRSALAGSGAMMLGGLVGDVSIPKQAGAGQFYWVNSEEADVTESRQTVGQVKLTPRHGAAHTRYSKQTLQQSSVDIEQFVRNDLLSIAALGIDSAGLSGSGVGGEPLGLRNTTGINKPSNFAGATPTWAEVLALVGAVADDNAMPMFGGQEDGRSGDASRFLMRGNMATALMGTSKDSGSGTFVLEFAGNQPRVGLWGVTVSNQVTDGDLMFGDWSQLLIGQWGDPDVLVNPYTGDTSGVVRITVHVLVDVAPRHIQAFGYNT